MCSSEEKSEDDLPGLAPNGSPLIHDLVLFQSGPLVKLCLTREKTVRYAQEQDKGLFQRRDDGFASAGCLGRRYGAFWAVHGNIPRPVTVAKNPEMARPQHNSG
ncbi:MAG: hypothetical protein ACLQPD_12740 [Desulfomonilaceae bacterium]